MKKIIINYGKTINAVNAYDFGIIQGQESNMMHHEKVVFKREK